MAAPFTTPAALVAEIERLHAIEMNPASWSGGDNDLSVTPGGVAQEAMWAHMREVLDDPAITGDARLLARVARCVVRSAGNTELPSKAGLLLAEAVLSAPAAGADAPILAACASLDRLEREYAAVSLADEDAPRLEEISGAQASLVALIGQTKARTLDGVRAKAASLALSYPHLITPETGDPGGVLTGSILRDLISAGFVSHDLDAELIVLCDECCRLEAESVRLYRFDGDEKETESNRLECQARALFDRILTMEPTTTEGRSAVARVALWFIGREADEVTIATDYIGERLAWKLVRYLAGGDQRAEMFRGAA